MGGKKEIVKKRWTVPWVKDDPHRELRAAKQLRGEWVGTRSTSYDVVVGKKKYEVKCPDAAGTIAVATLGRKAISTALGDLYHDLSLISANCIEELTENEVDAINEYCSTFVNGVSRKLSAELVRMFNRIDYSPSVDPTQPITAREVFEDVDALFLAWKEGWTVIERKDFDARLKYSRYSGGLVKLALV